MTAFAGNFKVKLSLFGFGLSYFTLFNAIFYVMVGYFYLDCFLKFKYFTQLTCDSVQYR
jgi:hypothetical protein